MRGWDYRTYWKGENLVRRFTFDSLEDYLAYLEDAQVQDAFAGGAASELGSAEFTGTDSLQQAIELARYGWHEGFGKLVHLTETVKRAMDYSPQVHSTFHDYVGFAPDVKAYMEGSPLSMINAPVVQKPHISVYMNTSIDGFVDEADVYRRGAAVLAIAEVVEACGIMVDLHLFEMSFIDKDVMLAEFAVKARDERVNLAKLHFPLCHPSWIRRLNFRLIETMPNVTQAWAGSYGIPAERRMMESVLELAEGDVLVPTLDEMKKSCQGTFTFDTSDAKAGLVGNANGQGASLDASRRIAHPAGSEEAEVVAVARCIADAVNPVLPDDKKLAFKARA